MLVKYETRQYPVLNIKLPFQASLFVLSVDYYSDIKSTTQLP